MLSILGGLILTCKSKFYHQCNQYTTTATKHSVNANCFTLVVLYIKDLTQDVRIYLLAGLWPIPVQLQWNGQSRTGLRPYPKSCDHEFTG